MYTFFREKDPLHPLHRPEKRCMVQDPPLISTWVIFRHRQQPAVVLARQPVKHMFVQFYEQAELDRDTHRLLLSQNVSIAVSWR